MLSIQPPTTTTHPKPCTPNLLPARIHHNGPINDTKRYWKPETDDKGTQHAHFRGRHLHGTSMTLPPNYTGAILHMTNNPAPKKQRIEEVEGEDEEMEDVKVAEHIGAFERIVVWEHGGKVDKERDVYVRGLEEWVGWAERMHGGEDGKGMGEVGA